MILKHPILPKQFSIEEWDKSVIIENYSMKRLTILTLLFSLCVLGGAVYYRLNHFPKTPSPAAFLPEQVLLYSHQRSFGVLAEDMQKQPLANSLRSINFVKLALDLSFSLNTVERIRELQEFLLSRKAEMIFQEFLSNDFTISLLGDEKATDFYEFLENNLILFAQPQHSLSITSTLMNVAGKGMVITSAQYGKYQIYRIGLDQEITVSIVAVDHLVLAALQERTLRQALDHYDEKKVNLSENFFFAEKSNQYKKAEFFCYFSVARLKKQLESILSKKSQAQTNVLFHLGKWSGITSGACALQAGEKFSQVVFTVNYTKNEIHSKAARLLAIAPVTNSYFAKVPENTTLYYWTNTFDLTTMLDMYASETSMDEKAIADIKNRVASLAGIRFEELENLINNNIHVIVGEPSTVNFVPIPNFALIFQLNDERKASSMVKQFLLNSGVPHQNDIYKGIPFSFWGEVKQKGLQPVYAIYDDALHISSSVSMHKKLVDTKNNGKSIINNVTFKRCGGDSLLKENNSTVFIQFAQFLESMEGLLKWFGTMLSIQNRKTAYKSRKIIYDCILPLIDGLKMYSSVATRSYIGEGKITIETYWTRTEQQ